VKKRPWFMLVLVGLLLVPPGPPSSAQGARYRPPVVSDGMVFPVARTDWYSVISFSNDWHLPRMRKIDGRWVLVGRHEGTDIFAEPETPVRAVLGGRVEASGWIFYSGWRLGIRGDDGRYWFYAHLTSPPKQRVGQRVETGEVIGTVGNTGYGDVPGHKDEFVHHLHLGIRSASGVWENPYPLVRRLYRQAVLKG
jgi:murein DD-endopeptidase MepM/ murein hydrolase activator NlpD